MPLSLRTIYLAIAAVAVGLALPTAVHFLRSTPPALPSTGAVVAGDSKTTCIYTGASDWAANLRVVEKATGINYKCIETFSNSDPTWSAWESPWITGSYGFARWLAADKKNRTIIITQQLIPDSVCTSVCSSPLRWEKVCDTGAFNGYARRLAQRLVSAGFSSSVVRLGDEMNGPWENDYAGTTRQQQRAWALCYAQEVGAMRGVKGQHLLFDWNVNACSDNDPLGNLYPGNAYVDIVGIDAYDGFCKPNPPTKGSFAAFARLANEPDGLNAVTAFAKLHGKPASLPEWGAVTVSDSGIGDDGSYIRGIKRYIARNNVAFQSYFDDGNGGVLQLNSSNPSILAAYIASFKKTAHR